MTTSDLLVGVHDLLRRPGTRLVVKGDVDLGGLSTSSAVVPEGTRAEVEVTLDSINDGVVLIAELDVPWEGDCRRCLEPARGTARVQVHEIFRVEPLEDMLPIVDEAIDVAAAVRDAALLSLPLAPLCSENCRGPAPGEFPVKTAEDNAVLSGDPRWAALDELRFDSAPEND